ncbi:MAG: Hsp20/alpha crystallin family protein [Gemmatimonadales bacterium]
MSIFITSRRPLDPFSNLRRLNSALDEAFGSWPAQENFPASSWFPACDVFEDKDSVKLLAELPGVRPEDVKLSVENNLLTIRGEKQRQSGDLSGKVHSVERSYGRFERSFALPSTIDPDRISASFEHGILTVTIPKAERARPREIPVSAH